MIRLRKTISLVLALALMLALFACGNTGETTGTNGTPPPASQTPGGAAPSASQNEPAPTDDGEARKYGGILRSATAAEGASPIGVPWLTVNADSVLTPGIFEGLMIATTAGEYIFCLADSYEVDTEKLELTVHLKSGIKFHDGSDFNAEVAAWNIMKGVEFRRANQHITGCEVIDDSTFVMKLDTWNNNILSTLAGVYMMSKEGYEKNGEEWALENPTGTGPFLFVEYVPGSHVKTVRNPNYWQEGLPYLDGVEYVFLREPASQIIAMQTEGDEGINAIQGGTAENHATLRDMGFSVVMCPTGNVSLVPSTRDPNSPLAKLEVRQAISYAIDRDAIVAARGFGISTAATQWVNEDNMARLDDSHNLSYNPEKARELLAQAGYPNGFKTTLYQQPGVGDKDATIAMQAMLKEVGIDAALETPDSGGYSSLRSSGWEGLLVQGCMVYANVATSFGLYFDEDYVYMTSVERPEGYIDIYNAATQSAEIEPKLLQDLHEAVLENLMFIPIFMMYRLASTHTNVRDSDFCVLERNSQTYCWIEKD